MWFRLSSRPGLTNAKTRPPQLARLINSMFCMLPQLDVGLAALSRPVEVGEPLRSARSPKPSGFFYWPGGSLQIGIVDAAGVAFEIMATPRAHPGP